MWKCLDRTLAVLLGLGAGIGHTLGSLAAYAHEPMTLLWSLNTSVLGVTLAALHLLRSFRSGDRTLALLLIFPTLAWLVSSLHFGALIHTPADPRVVFFIVLSLGLIAFSVSGALGEGQRSLSTPT